MCSAGQRKSSVANDDDHDVPTWNRIHTHLDNIMQVYASTAGG
jgi:hypothetical protein